MSSAVLNLLGLCSIRSFFVLNERNTSRFTPLLKQLTLCDCAVFRENSVELVLIDVVAEGLNKEFLIFDGFILRFTLVSGLVVIFFGLRILHWLVGLFLWSVVGRVASDSCSFSKLDILF
jgi:hypothetical protein